MSSTVDYSDKLVGEKPGPSFHDVIRADGDTPPEVMTLEVMPQQSTEDIAFERYTSQSFFDAEMEKMWCKVWQFACRQEHIPEIGDYFVYDIGRHSILIVRVAENEIKAYHNSCMHRGTKLKPSETSGNSVEIQCPFHGWTYQLDGTLGEVPCSWEFPHLDYDANHLVEVQADAWNSLVFINMDLEAGPLLDFLEVLPDHCKDWQLGDWYISAHARKELNCNWKAVQEAFIEAYHTRMVHPQYMPVSGDVNQKHDIFGDHVSRDIVLLGSPSPLYPEPVSEQEIVDMMLMGDRSSVDENKLVVPKGETARRVIAEHLRKTLGEEYGVDLSGMSTSEMVDSIKYTLFPNLFIFTGVSLRILYQYRPLGVDKDRCIFDIMFMRPVPKDGVRPDPATVCLVGEEDSYCDVPGMDPGFGNLFDQDTALMHWQREGMYASVKGAQTYSVYLESRLRHIHGTIDKYLRT